MTENAPTVVLPEVAAADEAVDRAVDGAADAAVDIADSPTSGFRVHLSVFEGPFDLLLGLISKHKLDVTEVALSVVTDEFISYIKSFGEEWDLEQTTHFLVVAATLLDLKTARLLPAAEVEDEDDLALLEARDLLFAKLLQYRAYKTVGAELALRMAEAGRRHPRIVGLEPEFEALLPEVLLGVGADGLAALAAKALAPRPQSLVSTTHIHAPKVSVREQALLLIDRLRRQRTSSFRQLISDADGTVTVIARFLALLELFKEGAVAFDQMQPLGELTIRWTGADDGELDVNDEFDDDAGGSPSESESESESENPSMQVIELPSTGDSEARQ